APPHALPPLERIWGHGGWMEARDREALDWLILVRFLGWSARVYRVLPSGKLETPLSTKHRVVILGCDPGDVVEETARMIAALLAEVPGLVIARATNQASALAGLGAASSTGETYETETIDWHGPGPHRVCRLRKPVAAQKLSIRGDSEIWAASSDLPVIA